MNRFREELKVIPGAARVIVAVIWLIYAAIFWFVLHHHGWWVALLVPLFLSAYVLLVGYVNGDARRRGMRYVLWTLLAIFIPNAIGIILYFVMRDPLMRNCLKCSAMIAGGFAYCPKCGSPQSQSCPACHRPVESEWSHCPNCGSLLSM